MYKKAAAAKNELGGDDITKRLQEISDLLIRLPKEQLQNERKLGSLEEAEIKSMKNYVI